MVRRVNITLSDSDYEVLKSYSIIMGRSPTRLVGDLLQELIPFFLVLLKLQRLLMMIAVLHLVSFKLYYSLVFIKLPLLVLSI